MNRGGESCLGVDLNPQFLKRQQVELSLHQGPDNDTDHERNDKAHQVSFVFVCASHPVASGVLPRLFGGRFTLHIYCSTKARSIT